MAGYQANVLYFGRKGGNDNEVVDMTMKAGGSKLFNRKVGTGQRIAVIGQQIVQYSLRGNAKRKQQQEKCCEETIYVIGLFQ